MNRRLYRSRYDRKLRGVCAGLADYFGLDVSLVRLMFVLATIFTVGHAALAYIILAIVLPEAPADDVPA